MAVLQYNRLACGIVNLLKIYDINRIYSQRATVDDALEHSWLKVIRNFLFSNNMVQYLFI